MNKTGVDGTISCEDFAECFETPRWLELFANKTVDAEGCQVRQPSGLDERHPLRGLLRHSLDHQLDALFLRVQPLELVEAQVAVVVEVCLFGRPQHCVFSILLGPALQ